MSIRMEAELPHAGSVNEARLTGIVVALNEAEFLRDCLPTLAFCDELIVVDLGSQDDSQLVAREHGARVIEHARVPFAEKVHAFAVEEAAYNWVMLADADMTFPSWLGERIKPMLTRYDLAGLGMLLLPMLTFSDRGQLLDGRKGGVRGRKAVIHRERVDIPGWLHHRGFQARPGYLTLGLVSPGGEGLHHYSIHQLRGVLGKAGRYLPYEAESRYLTGQRFSWMTLIRELYWKLREDLRLKAYSERIAFQLMLFQIINVFRANMALRRYCRQRLPEQLREKQV